jgi:hypothetical protein
MQAQVVQLSVLEVAEFAQSAKHVVEIAEELKAIARYVHLPRLEDEVKRFAWAAGQAAAASEQLQLCLARAGLTPPASMQVAAAASRAADREVMPELSSVETAPARKGDAVNGRATKQEAR